MSFGTSCFMKDTLLKVIKLYLCYNSYGFFYVPSLFIKYTKFYLLELLMYFIIPSCKLISH